MAVRYICQAYIMFQVINKGILIYCRDDRARRDFMVIGQLYIEGITILILGANMLLSICGN